MSKNAIGQFDFDNVNGFVSRGTIGTGAAIGLSARGTMLLWHPRSASFRAGEANVQWDEPNLGINSVAMGSFSLASGTRVPTAENAQLRAQVAPISARLEAIEARGMATGIAVARGQHRGRRDLIR